jgi:hypothetical protein
MSRNLHRAFFAVLIMVTVILSTISVCLAQDNRIAYQLLNKLDGNVTYELNIVVPQSLLQYYDGKRTDLRTSNFPDFVTPYALKPIADCLWQIYTTDEDFTNGVLMLVHQITYVETAPAKYPVETMVEGEGDCDLFSFVAASILEAGGIDVVLLYYETLSHMNIGVHLSDPPRNARDSIYFMTSNDTKYYIAECTGGNWKEGWRVGECPEDCKQASSEIYTLEESELIAPGQVSASFTALETSTIYLEISSLVLLQNGAITLRGQISPDIVNGNVTIYAKFNISPWRVIGTTLTKSDGSFEYRWMADTAGLCAMQASWSGNDQYTGAMSSTRNTIVVPFFITVLAGVVILVVVVSAIAVVVSRQTRRPIQDNGNPAVTISYQ